MNLDKVTTALTSKYELFDATRVRLLPKEIVAAYVSSDKKIHRGIILSVFERHTKIVDELGKFYLVSPEKQLIITKQVKDEEIYTLLLKKYEEALAENKNKVYTKYICAAYKNTNNDTFGLALLPMQFTNRQTFTKESWEEFKYKYTNLSDRIYYPLIDFNEFRDFNDIHLYNETKLFGIGDTKFQMRYKFGWYELDDNYSVKELMFNHNDKYAFKHFKELLCWASNIYAWNNFSKKQHLKNGQIKL